MIYLDYAESTPISVKALDSFIKISKDLCGGINSNNKLGEIAKNILLDTTKELSDYFNILDREIIYTSSVEEANNMAIIGACLANCDKGKHIIVSKLEEKSIYKICDYLISLGFEVSFVNNDSDGLISFEDLKNKIRKDTILVSITALNKEMGIREPLKMLRQIIKKENENTIFHSDLSNAIGKTSISFRDIDLGTIDSGKIYGPKGIGFLYKNSNIKIKPLLYGNYKNKLYKPGELSIPLIVSMKTAILTVLKDLDKREKFINVLNEKIISKLSSLKGVKINKTKYCVPYIISLSLDRVDVKKLISALESKDIYISCNNNEINTSVMAVYNDIERSKNTLRISLSSLTSLKEIDSFLDAFVVEYNRLIYFN